MSFQDLQISSSFREGDLVFAKIRRHVHPFWPSKIIKKILTHQKVIKHHVRFFGTKQTAVVPECDIVKYNESSVAKFNINKNRKWRHFTLAIEEASETQNMMNKLKPKTVKHKRIIKEKKTIKSTFRCTICSSISETRVHLSAHLAKEHYHKQLLRKIQVTSSHLGYSCPEEDCDYKDWRKEPVVHHISQQHELVFKMCDADMQRQRSIYTKNKVGGDMKEERKVIESDKWDNVCQEKRLELIKCLQNKNYDNSYTKTIKELKRNYKKKFGKNIPQ